MIRIELNTIINKPIKEAFERLTDLEGYNSWMNKSGLFIHNRKTSEGPISIRTSFTNKVGEERQSEKLWNIKDQH